MSITLIFRFHICKAKNLYHISTWNSLLKCNKNVPFLKQTVIGDEKCILYNNVERKGSWGNWNEPPPTTPKAVCIQRMWGCIYGEIRRESSIISSLQKTRLLNSSKYPSQLDQLKAALNQKHLKFVNRKCIIFYQDSTRLHISLMTRQKLLQLGWGVLIHLLYSPDTVPLDFHLFWSSENSIHGGFVTKSCMTLGTPWAVAYQVPLPMAFPRQEYWSGFPFSSPGDTHLGILWTHVSYIAGSLLHCRWILYCCHFPGSL